MKRNTKVFYYILIGANILILLAGILMGYKTNKPLYFFFRDITATMVMPPYIGFVSQWGNMLWAILSGICFYNYILLNNVNTKSNSKKFFFWSFLLVLMFTVDDVFLLHEEVIYWIFNISQKYVYGFYIFLLLIYLIRFYRYIMSTGYALFIVALILFGSSIVFDYLIAIINLSQEYIFLEDGFKLFGIISWIVYFTNTGIDELKNLYGYDKL